ncbi:MAG: glycosyltransferase [Bacteroidetes bacterium]|nr:glycosyltransferase [Bacteroidota bacterium]
MPRVLRIINRFNLGGPTYNAAYLSKYLNGDFKTLLVGGANDETEENSEYIVRSLGLRPLIIPEMKRSISPRNDMIAYAKIKEIIRRFKPDIVHTHASKAGALGRRAATVMEVPVVVHTFHGHVFDAYFNSVKSAFYRGIERNLADHTTKIVALSENQRDDLVKKYKICAREKIEIVPLGFDLDRFRVDMEIKRSAFRKEYLVDDDEIAVGIIGRVVPIKNHSFFLDAVKYVLENTDKKIRIFIIGDGEDRPLIEEKTAALGIPFINTHLADHIEKVTVTFTSWIKDIDVVMAGLDIIALTSLNEGTPVSLIEAQAANKPIVSTAVGGIKNVVIPGVTALLSPKGNLNQFSQNMLALVEKESMRKKMGNDGWDFVARKFHYTRLVNDMQNLYYSLLG